MARVAALAVPWGQLAEIFGVAMMVAGLALAIWGGLKHGAALQALPYPREDGTVIRSGPYRIVRHPIYSGALVGGCSAGRSGAMAGSRSLYAALLFLLFDAKARREEEWLVEKFPSYAEYRRRVRKLVPFVY